MSRSEFADECPDCRPVLIDPKTGTLMPDTHPAVKAVKLAWSESTLEQRQAFHRITCLNSRSVEDTDIVMPLIKRMQQLAGN